MTKKLFIVFALAAATGGCASLGLKNPGIEPSPDGQTGRCIADLALQAAAPEFMSNPNIGFVRLEPLQFREIVRECAAREQAGPSYYQGAETITVPRIRHYPQ